MPKLVVITREGDECVVEIDNEMTVMEAIRDNGFDELLALCGGCCSCATCHIHVDDNFVEKLPKMSEDEDTLLDCSDHRRSSSRLSCQIQFSQDLDGLKVTIAPKE
jgi:2Fe-2S ferredoxin